MGGITGKNTDGSASTGRNDGGIRFDAAVHGIDVRCERSRLSGGPQGQVSERSGGHDRRVEGIGLRVEGTPQLLAGMSKLRLPPATRAGPPEGPAAARVSTIRHGAIGTKRSGKGPAVPVRVPAVAELKPVRAVQVALCAVTLTKNIADQVSHSESIRENGRWK